jgi:hypothetical protein
MSPFQFVVLQVLELVHPVILIVLILAALGAMGGRSVSGQVGQGLAGVLGALVSGAISLLKIYFTWSKETASLTASRVLAGTNAGKLEHDLYRGAFTVLIWAVTYLAVFFPWLPASALAPPPASGFAGASTPEQIATSWVNTLHSAQRRGNGGVEVNGRGHPRAQIEAAIQIVNDPVQAAAAGLPTDLQASPSTRLRGFVRVTPNSGANGLPIQDFP